MARTLHVLGFAYGEGWRVLTASAREYGEGEATLFAELPNDTRRVVALLSEGLGDEQIARELEVSARTVQRRVERLMQLLGCESRFALGYRIGRLGRPGSP